MPVSISRYIDITSGVGAGSAVPTRNLGGLIVTGNNLCPTGSFVSFTSASDVGDFFGTSSEEYARAVFYFGWVSKSISTPSQLSFWFWNSDVPTASLIWGNQATYAVGTFTPITTGDFTLTMGGFTTHLTGITFAGITSLAQVASTVQTAIRAITGNGAAWTSASVTFNATTGQFNLVSGLLGADTIAVTAGTTTDVAGPLGWLTGAVLSNGTAAQTVAQNLNSLLQITNNFGVFSYSQTPFLRANFTASFLSGSMISVSSVQAGTVSVGELLAGTSVPAGTAITGLGTGTGSTGTYTVNTLSSFTLGATSITATQGITLTELESAATWNQSTNPNIMFMFSVQVSSANAAAWASAFADIGGTTLTLASPVTTEYPEMVPAMIAGATNYEGTNTVQNYMFQQFNLTPSVTTDAAANIYDPLLINYYGQTETAGQNLAFYQRGVMMGIGTYPTDQNTYVNEMALKDAISAQVMTLLLGLPEIPANSTGKAILTAGILSVVKQYLTNGSIEVGKTLTTAQKAYIGNATGSTTAWQQVQTSGYWLNVVISQYTVDGVNQYKAVYTLIYSKNDTIRLVQGTDVLI